MLQRISFSHPRSRALLVKARLPEASLERGRVVVCLIRSNPVFELCLDGGLCDLQHLYRVLGIVPHCKGPEVFRPPPLTDIGISGDDAPQFARSNWFPGFSPVLPADDRL